MSFGESDHNLSSSSFISTSDVLCNDDSFESIPPLKETLDSHFAQAFKNFNIVHINAQSIPAHYPDMLASFESDNVHAILVSESWLKPSLPSISYSIPGFQLIRNDRNARGGGGVAIYLRAHIPFSIVRLSSQFLAENEAEYLFVEVLLSHNKLLLGVFYSPSSTVDYFTTLENLLEELTPLYTHTVLMGDFNTCLLKNDTRSLRLKSLIEAANLNILPLSETHFFPNCIPSLLDLVIVSSLDHVDKFGQCAANAFSYHDLLFLSYKIRPPKAKSRILLQRNFEDMDLEKLQKDAANMDWSVIIKACAVDEQVALFNSLLVQLYDAHAPVRPVRIRHPPAPWLTEDLKRLIGRKNNAKSSYRSDPKNDRIREKYRLLRNQCNKMCRDLRRRHIHKSVQNQDPCRVWNFLRSIGVGKTRSCPIPNNVDLNLLNQHFSSVSCLDNMAKSTTLTQLSSFPTPDFSPFVFRKFADCDVKKHILSIHSDAVGSDDVSRKMIIPLLDFLTPIITYILNFSISSSSFPSQWKDAQIIPLPKKANPSSFSDYRPISILPFLSKVLERLVQQQINSFCLRNSILSPLQSGFRSGHSTTTALLKITDDIRHGMENHQVTVLVLLDFSNAFNTVDHDILLEILRSLNISPTAISWFHSYLYGRRQRIRVQDRLSSWLDTVAGVPQGGVLSPLLFAIFINTITSQISSLYHLYADDLQIYLQTTIEDLPKAVECINKDLACILDWSRSYGLTVNPLKSQAIIIGSSRMISKIKKCQLQPIVFNGVLIPYNDIVKNLGILLDSNLSWTPQINAVSRKMFAAYAALRRLNYFLPTSTKITLAQSLLLPILDYADICYLDITEEQLNKLERLQNLCIRFIFGLRKYDHVSEYRTKLKWLPIRLRRNTHILSALYCILFNISSPPYLKERFKFLSSCHDFSLRSKENLSLQCPVHSSTFYDKSFAVLGVRLWNSLPHSIKSAQSLNVFKKQVKEHYLSL